jgi:hypothetical protein
LIAEPKNTGDWPGKKADQIERAARALNQVDVFAQLADLGRELGVEQSGCPDRRAAPIRCAAPRRRQNAAAGRSAGDRRHESLAHADRPGDRRAFDAEYRFDFLEQVEGLAHLAVELVDESDDRRLRMRQTLSSLIVCASTPLAASMTITAASTAVRTR